MLISDMPEFKDKSQVMTFEKNVLVATAVDAMAEKNYGAILVTDNGRLCGVFTERDLLRRIAASRIDISKTHLADVMTTNIKTARIDDKVSDCLRRMSQGRFRHMPIVDEHGNLKGLLSQGDFVAFTMSDAIYRAGMSAKAGITGGSGAPITILAAILVYTLGLLFIISAFESWQ